MTEQFEISEQAFTRYTDICAKLKDLGFTAAPDFVEGMFNDPRYVEIGYVNICTKTLHYGQAFTGERNGVMFLVIREENPGDALNWHIVDEFMGLTRIHTDKELLKSIEHKLYESFENIPKDCRLYPEQFIYLWEPVCAYLKKLNRKETTDDDR